ncbi:esterase/lipase family protein [Ideonella livida]|uniref:Alpha/beta hydrolase n=1 Tax=Ideonella livida TaxID=2707176 RepID=A0A7C9PJ51_9BURK|nr:hypothetical protein [Ideonella livida]NDY93293.1 hypothetical protein [Ideonella livida]
MTPSTPSPRDTLVLVHGYLGYGDAPWGLALPDRLAYFRGVEAALRAAGHHVVVAQLPPQARVAQRAEALARLLADGQACPGERLHLIAHSMGGLDALHALHHHREATARVQGVASLGTPFRGTPMADLLTGQGVNLPGPLAQLQAMSLLPLGGALQDLSTAGASALTAASPLNLRVRWITVTGRDAATQDEDTLFKAMARLPVFRHQPNDGLVPLASCRLQGAQMALDWPADHAQLAGWTLWFRALPLQLGPALGPTEDHLRRYRELAALMVRD